MATGITTGPKAPAVAESRPPDLPSDHDVRELRLALVCYGGVSLAIYMHGITKELEKLARASTKLLEPGNDNPFPPDKTEHAYYNALRRKAAKDGFRTRVVIDIISGTSAGGINGVCLAKAIALDAPQDGLRDLWLTKGAILKLLSLVPKLPPLAGNRMLKWLGGAFGEMDGHGQGSLMPPGLALNLFVTTTDINGYNRQIPIARPAGDQHGRQQARLRVPPPRRRRQPRQHPQPGPCLRRARDLVLPGRVSRDGARRHPASAGDARASRPSSAASTSSPTRRST